MPEGRIFGYSALAENLRANNIQIPSTRSFPQPIKRMRSLKDCYVFARSECTSEPRERGPTLNENGCIRLVHQNKNIPVHYFYLSRPVPLNILLCRILNYGEKASRLRKSKRDPVHILQNRAKLLKYEESGSVEHRVCRGQGDSAFESVRKKYACGVRWPSLFRRSGDDLHCDEV